jgi:hypothetical protein
VKKQITLFFVKSPQPGQVKTRLAQDVGPEEAADIYRHLVQRLVRQFPMTLNLRVCFTPAEEEQTVREWLGPQLDAQGIEWQLEPQFEGDLGQRMSAAFAMAFADGAEKVLIIGSDTPGINNSHFQETWDALEEVDVVIGPAQDGGYYLLGLRAYVPELFEDVPWSSEETLDATMERAMEAGLEVSWLEELNDIDTLEDWQQLRGG